MIEHRLRRPAALAVLAAGVLKWRLLRRPGRARGAKRSIAVARRRIARELGRAAL